MDAANTGKQLLSRKPSHLAGKAVSPAPGDPEGRSMLRFTLVTGAWFVGLFGLMRLPWVERVLLTPFAGV